MVMVTRIRDKGRSKEPWKEMWLSMVEGTIGIVAGRELDIGGD